ncbi:MAG TPA: hypothetical protein VFN61_05545 [Acidimicrobiales bacterium]|nr:hypothetical protein [Acidimicrobiales bacterium]
MTAEGTQAPLDAGAAEAALETAQRARWAATRPIPVPTWYLSTIIALLAAYVASTDAARALSAPWLLGVFGAVYALSVGICIGLLYRRIGVVSFQGPYLAPTVLAVTTTFVVGAGTYVACAVAALPVRGVPAAITGSLTLGVGMTWVNRRVARDARQWQG